jgi:hypothetical protein
MLRQRLLALLPTCTGTPASKPSISTYPSTPRHSTPILKSSPSLGVFCCHRELAVVGAGKELRVQKCGKDGVPSLGIHTEQAPGLGGREPETGHLEVFRADSAQQFWR